MVLMENREGKLPNMTLLEGACDLALRLAILAAEKDWDHAAYLARLGELRQSDWLDTVWLRAALDQRC